MTAIGERSLRDSASASLPTLQDLSTESPQPLQSLNSQTVPEGSAIENADTSDQMQATAVDNLTVRDPAHEAPTAHLNAVGGDGDEIYDGWSSHYDGFVGGLRYYRDCLKGVRGDATISESIREWGEGVMDYILDLPGNLEEFIRDDLFSGELNHRDFEERYNGLRRSQKGEIKVEERKGEIVIGVTDMEAQSSPSEVPPKAPEFGKVHAWADTANNRELEFRFLQETNAKGETIEINSYTYKEFIRRFGLEEGERQWSKARKASLLEEGATVRSLVDLPNWKPHPLKKGDLGHVVEERGFDKFMVKFEKGVEGWLFRKNFQEYCFNCLDNGREEPVESHFKWCRFCGTKNPSVRQGNTPNFDRLKYVCCDCGKAMGRKDQKFCRHCGAAQAIYLKDPTQISDYSDHYDAEEDERLLHEYAEWKKIKEYNDARWPAFVMLWPSIVFLMWFFGAISASNKEENKDISFTDLQGGLDTISPGSTTLQVHEECDDLRLGFFFYRSILYQCTHLGFSHVLGNVLITWALGIGLEKLHGHATFIGCFLLGVIGGSYFFFVSDAHRIVAGMSGGVYAVLGMRIGNLMLNWTEKRQPLLESMLITFWLGWDLINYLHIVDKDANAATMSYSTHMGGMYTGCLLMFLFGHNLNRRRFEVHLKFIAYPALLFLPVFAISWGFSWPPRTVFDPVPWCWKKLVYNRTAFNDRAWHCVNCGNDEGSTCIIDWSNNIYTEDVTYTNCQEKYGWAYRELADQPWNITLPDPAPTPAPAANTATAAATTTEAQTTTR
mmetsp:Transcript_28715/g.46244  ORF Transcript_28715/g.46244 Transcript_28715/m.46244 type:complete len:782 (+) Transcript_28715:119-2464(+)